MPPVCIVASMLRLARPAACGSAHPVRNLVQQVSYEL